MTVFRRILDGPRIEAAAQSVLERWLPSYIAEVERQDGLAARSIALPHSIEVSNYDTDVEKWPEHQTPAVVVMAPGLTERPEKAGEGIYTARWALSIGAVVAPRGDKVSPRLLSARYAAAIRACILQHRTLEGVVMGIDWLDESYDDSGPLASRSLAACRVVFEVQVDDVVTAGAGPTGDPPDDPYDPPGEWGEAETVDVTISRLA
jgi:hypothetical protein